MSLIRYTRIKRFAEPCATTYRGAVRSLEERERRLARARVASRIEIGLGTVAISVPPFIFISAPTRFGGMFSQQSVGPDALLVFAYLAMVLGYAWMLRIRFTGPEDGARSNWRSH
jgi:hypothetical protein